MLTNMISPITAFAEEAYEPMTDAYLDAPADDVPEEMKVEFAFTPNEDVIVTEAHLRNGKKEDFAFDTDEYRKVSFLMADQDLFISLATEKRAPMTDITEAAQEDTGSVPALPEREVSYAEGNEFDPYQDDVSVEDLAWNDVPDHEYSNPDNAEAHEDNSATDPSAEPDIELTAAIEEDGLPAQGSIMTVDTLQIPYGAADFTPEKDFTNISYDESIDTVELISNEVDVNVPGTYSTIYRISHDNGAKMWYVLRPVTVMEMGEIREGKSRWRSRRSIKIQESRSRSIRTTASTRWR